ncbi:alpha-factor pheromone receptor STE2 [Cyberlindnera jadinii NRRL Y-1542]|uniref:Fungal pheromone mating factor STE2G-protein-coupled receptor n=1 Tax=Cyberlindnera jadinii (strain ATCC 18201 / CBS 1600 / BCRC 20928 / JCM 3617 / NBRC 0987 / NRRL Y-1542) TaxID=983966 RepID=A0A1E4S9J2_CYBJN|nr:fungal pheromone mating factor STE2G-protein-coupled receptor [Cyberlindnera jadinii NRRL Y-1542]ODV76180.1 fungal pheromone mating factor STE2G-protein-coupled receptor [Cyberlindnera jadinii NRRL Y-1542]
MDFFNISTLPEDFDPLTQILNYTSAYGPTYLTFAELDSVMHTNISNTIIFGVRIGAATFASIILFILSKKKTSPIFILNQLCLLLVIIHSCIYIAYLYGNYASIGFQFTQFTDIITRNDINISSATNLFQAFLITSIEASMVFQVRTLFQTPEMKWFGNAIFALSVLIGLSVVVLTLYVTINTVIGVFEFTSYQSRALDVQPILFAASINFMSVLLMYKLVLAIRSRRYLGLKQFDGFHILLIMSTQTLLVPSALMIVSYAVNSLYRISFTSVATLIVVLSLPLSSLWATSTTSSSTPSSGYNFSSLYGKTPGCYSDPGTASTKVDEMSRSQHTQYVEKSLYTPSTLAEEEAKRYWMSAATAGEYADEQFQGEPDFVSKTVHRINK